MSRAFTLIPFVLLHFTRHNAFFPMLVPGLRNKHQNAAYCSNVNQPEDDTNKNRYAQTMTNRGVSSNLIETRRDTIQR